MHATQTYILYSCVDVYGKGAFMKDNGTYPYLHK